MEEPLSSRGILGKRKKADVGDSEYVDSGFLDDDDLLIKDEDDEFDAASEISLPSGDEDDDDDDDLGLDTYNEDQEEFPKLAAYDEQLPQIKDKLLDILEGISTVLKKYPCDSTHVANFQRKAKELREIPNPEPVKIALLGDAGTGMYPTE
jgi:hypothetical protein